MKPLCSYATSGVVVVVVVVVDVVVVAAAAVAVGVAFVHMPLNTEVAISLIHQRLLWLHSSLALFQRRPIVMDNWLCAKDISCPCVP